MFINVVIFDNTQHFSLLSTFDACYSIVAIDESIGKSLGKQRLKKGINCGWDKKKTGKVHWSRSIIIVNIVEELRVEHLCNFEGIYANMDNRTTHWQLKSTRIQTLRTRSGPKVCTIRDFHHVWHWHLRPLCMLLTTRNKSGEINQHLVQHPSQFHLLVCVKVSQSYCCDRL